MDCSSRTPNDGPVAEWYASSHFTTGVPPSRRLPRSVTDRDRLERSTVHLRNSASDTLAGATLFAALTRTKRKGSAQNFAVRRAEDGSVGLRVRDVDPDVDVFVRVLLGRFGQRFVDVQEIRKTKLLSD